MPSDNFDAVAQLPVILQSFAFWQFIDNLSFTAFT